MLARDQVDALLSIIRHAAYNALDQYETTGTPLPTLESIDVHPIDRADNIFELKKVISTLEGACGQLCSMLAPPSHTILNRAQDFAWTCLRVAINHRIADELKQHPAGIHVNDLSVKVNIHPMKLASILRVLATNHCFYEVSPEVFTNNRLSIILASDQPFAPLVDLMTEDGQKSAVALPEYLLDPEFGQSMNMSKTVFQFRNRHEGRERITRYDWLQLKENEGRLKVMMSALVGWNRIMGSLSVLHVYPWSNIRTVCDVGSGLGSFSRSLLEMFPHVEVVQFDLPKTISVAREHWKDSFIERNTFVDGDFLSHIPVPNCDVYYLRNILHNWSDENALVILSSVRGAMGSHSRVLTHDHVLRHMSDSSSTGEDGLDRAPKPMLPNYGAGQVRIYNQDLMMMMQYNTKERTTNETIAIGKSAGLSVLQIFDFGEMSAIEFGIERNGI